MYPHSDSLVLNRHTSRGVPRSVGSDQMLKQRRKLKQVPAASVGTHLLG
jgi:hypothetical protein